MMVPEPDTRTYAEFFAELTAIREQPLDAQLQFMRNRRNRDRAACIPAHKLTKILLG